MSLIPAPFKIKSKTYRVTSTDLINSIPIGPTVVKIGYIHLKSDDTLYDGYTAIQVLRNDGTWAEIHAVNNPASYAAVDNLARQNAGFWSNTLPPQDPVFPFQFRIFIVTKCTQGFCDIDMEYF